MLAKLPQPNTVLRYSIKVTTATRSFGIARSQGNKPSHLEKNEALGRPLSPHVTIYAFPLAAISSITHRITGLGLVVGVYSIGMGELFGMNMESLVQSIGNTSVIGPLAKMSVTFPLVFHTLGGVRHLYWEKYPQGLTAPSQYQASVALYAVSGLAALGAALV